ncbi:hypothetical protein [Vibrio salinus]|uniref:hypothetical protein n=1 Tax=Vibrio salinus TaxID=2899784 RepID=UPI001E287D01|nr:hypothetical protein [Vibrio salinus]MCE0494796.1 hypothetical protein [Vibrio salinus]
MVTSFLFFRPLFNTLLIIGLSLLPVLSLAETANDSPWSISGFGSISVGKLDTEQANYRGYTDALSLKPDSLLGLQVSYQFNETFSATVQGTIKDDNKKYKDYNDDIINWAYLTWLANDHLTLKAGRMRAPFLAYSDANDISYAYPWITLPKQSYNGWLFQTYDGVDISWGNSFDDFDTSLESYIGTYSNNTDVNGLNTDYRVNFFGGLVGKINYNNFQFRISQHRGEVNMNVDNLINMAKSYLSIAILNAKSISEANKLSSLASSVNDADFSSKGFFDVSQASVSYDGLQYFTRAEWVQIKTGDIDFAPDMESYYLTGGYITFPWTFSLTYADSRVKYNEPMESYRHIEALSPITSFLANDSVRVWTLGTRWDIKPQIALKAEISYIDGYEDKESYFTSIKDGFDRKAALYKLSVQWVF